jgi:hypothetical protein
MSTIFSPSSARPRRTSPALERARLTVVPGRARQASRVPFVTLVSLLLLGGVVGLLLFNTHMQQASFVATDLQQRAEVLAGREESLTMQLHRLRDPQHVAAEAKQLGMVPAGTPAFIRLEDGSVLGRPEVAQAGAGLAIRPAARLKPQSLRPRLVIAEVPRGSHTGRENSRTTETSAADSSAAADAGGARRSQGRTR